MSVARKFFSFTPSIVQELEKALAHSVCFGWQRARRGRFETKLRQRRRNLLRVFFMQLRDTYSCYCNDCHFNGAINPTMKSGYCSVERVMGAGPNLVDGQVQQYQYIRIGCSLGNRSVCPISKLSSLRRRFGLLWR